MRHILLHGHIFKNAGSTLDWSLRRSFGPGFCEHRNDQVMRDTPDAALRDALRDPALMALSSHNLPSQPPRARGICFHTVFLLRDPVERVLSVYAFERAQQANTPGARAAKRMTLQEYVGWRLQDDVRPVIRDFQTRFLAGAAWRRSSDALSEHALAEARRQVEESALVGIVSRYDDSMVMIEAALEGYFPRLDLAYVAQNVRRGGAGAAASATPAKVQLGSLFDEVLAHNRHDSALYALASEQLEQRITALADFARRREAFQCRRSALDSSVPGARW